MSGNFNSGWARVISDDVYRNRVARVVDVMPGLGIDWITLEIDGKEILFEEKELQPCSAPAVQVSAVRSKC